MFRMMSRHRVWRTVAALAAPGLALCMTGGCPFNPNDNGNSNANANTNTNSAPVTGNSGLTGKFAGATRCSLCHQNVHTNWTGTLHAKAYETLEKIGQQNNAECVGCHTVGFGEPGGWVDRATTNDLAGVGCESCHGGAAEHANNASDATKRPTIDISADVCGKCHTDVHHPNFEDWTASNHGKVTESVAEEFVAGNNLQSCGKCHSGDYFYNLNIKQPGTMLANDALKGKDPAKITAITCAICHNPHQKTGNAGAPEDGRDYQLRYAEVKFTTPTNTLTAAQDPTRFNLCGQCHHARDRVWTDSSREPHPSDQVNVFFGEMPLPAAKPDPIIVSRPSVHLNAPEQCATCHVYRKPFESDLAPTVSGHTFEVNFGGCAASGCHPTPEVAMAKFDGLNAEFESRLALVKQALDAWQTRYGLGWNYTSDGGPNAAGQARIPDAIKKARYIYYYIENGGGNGVHNPDYVREGLINALSLATSAPAPTP